MARSNTRRQSSLYVVCTVAVALVSLCYATTLPDLTGGNSNFTVYDDNHKPCLQASFELNFYIYYNSSGNNNTGSGAGLTKANVQLPRPENVSGIYGVCNKESGIYSLNISWYSETNFSTELRFNNFSTDNQSRQWSLYQILFTFNSSNKDYFGSLQGDLGEGDSERLVYYTEQAPWFNRTVQLDQYFLCEGCKKFKFSSESGACQGNTTCSYVTLAKAAIFLGDFAIARPEKQICFEDWVAQREVLVPIAVGGFLCFLLVIVILAYVVAFIKRYVRDKRAYHKMN